MEQKNELYHYGRKGMKWGKNIFSKEDLKRLWDKRITGEYYLRGGQPIKNTQYKRSSTYAYNKGYEGHMKDAQRSFRSSRASRVAYEFPNLYSKEAMRAHGEQATYRNIKGRRSENRANQLLHNYRTKSLKGITESNTKKVKNWISTRPSAVKKKVSEIKEKIAKAESGKKTVTYPLSRDANKKKTKKSTIKSSSHYMSNY